MPDDALRAACFASLDVLCATHGEDIPYRGGLDAGFAFRGRRVPFLSTQKGIFRAAAQEGEAALAIQTSAKSPYDDEETPDGFFYAYRDGSIDQPDNRALRAAYAQAAPLVYFVATVPGRYKPLYPVYVIADDAAARRVLVSPGRMAGPLDEPDPVLPDDPLERRYAVRETRIRLHQARFRGRVLVAYSGRCTICQLRETGCWTPPTSQATSNNTESRLSRTVSPCVRYITAHSTRTSSASRPITRSTFRHAFLTMRTDRCSSCSRRSTPAPSNCQGGRRGGPTASGLRSVSTASGPSSLASRGLQAGAS